MINIQEPSRPWEIVHMDWVAGLPPGSDRSYTSFLVIADKISITAIFLPCHKDDTVMDTALVIWKRVVSWTGIFANIISERGPKFTSALWKNLHQLFGGRISFSTAYHPQYQPVSQNQSTTMTAKYYKPVVKPRYQQNMELIQISSEVIKRKRKLTTFLRNKLDHHRTRDNKVIPAQSCC
ncbi:hypothetical protein O181_105198 [Austropuccinia psidii MF-1]|uniref:Integrase catalytic domain-containing protein n=1 Tax=Austropuccinia psidii MF-1 TaxID=1389203 RepID=A0A9Q3JNJ9_9BASI|nr:hypothetical protein [Austropuccinia psidii MF-1]